MTDHNVTSPKTDYRPLIALTVWISVVLAFASFDAYISQSRHLPLGGFSGFWGGIGLSIVATILSAALFSIAIIFVCSRRVVRDESH